MSDANSLTNEQIESIRRWAGDGADLADIQKRLFEEFEIKVTYLETRFLLEDLAIEMVPKEEPQPDEVDEPEEAEEAEEAESQQPGEDADMGAGDTGDLPENAEGEENVTVTVDSVLRPGALISGQATFSDGNTAAWWLDQMGRLGMDPGDPDFRPNEQQARAFQIALQRKIQETGM